MKVSRKATSEFTGMSYEANRARAVGRKTKLTPELTEVYPEIVQSADTEARLLGRGLIALSEKQKQSKKGPRFVG